VFIASIRHGLVVKSHCLVVATYKEPENEKKALKINTQTISVTAIIGLLVSIGMGYLDLRDRSTRMEAQLEILAPVAIDHMVALELEKREATLYKPPIYVGSVGNTGNASTTGGDGTHGNDGILTGAGMSLPPGHPPISEKELEKIKEEKRAMYEQRED